MALAISTSTNLCSFSPFPNSKSTTFYLSHYPISCPKSPMSNISTLGLRPLSSWNGLRHLGISISHKSIRKIERKGRCKGKLVYASLFGVGAPEALVIGVVALLVFGPKGLAEVARNLGQTLRTFQPTIRELQNVSREFKSTLEREIGLDDISMSSQNTYNSNTTQTTLTPSSSSATIEDIASTPSSSSATVEDIASTSSSSSATVEDIASTSSPSAIAENSGPPIDLNDDPSPNRAYTSEEYLKITEEQLKASTSQEQEQTPSTPVAEIPLETQPQPQGTAEEAPAVTPSLQKSERHETL